MTHFIGRTVASDDAMHATVLFVINDEEMWMLVIIRSRIERTLDKMYFFTYNIP